MTGSTYAGVKVPHGGFVEIDLFEVRADAQHTGVGRKAIALLHRRCQGRLLIALSMDEVSDCFWLALGWMRYEKRRSDGSRSLFMSATN